MRRIGRYILNALTVLSLVLCVATVALWIRGYVISDEFYRGAYEDIGDRTYWTQDIVFVGRGGVGVMRGAQGLSAGFRGLGHSFHTTYPAAYPNFNINSVAPGSESAWAGFRYAKVSVPDPRRSRPKAYLWELVVPLWPVVALTALLPAFRVWRWHRRRFAAGRCQKCGYDLRATPDRCPECGTIPTKVKA
jgi:hypothetical protein